jgi:hypothetical protein
MNQNPMPGSKAWHGIFSMQKAEGKGNDPIPSAF